MLGLPYETNVLYLNSKLDLFIALVSATLPHMLFSISESDNQAGKVPTSLYQQLHLKRTVFHGSRLCHVQCFPSVA